MLDSHDILLNAFRGKHSNDTTKVKLMKNTLTLLLVIFTTGVLMAETQKATFAAGCFWGVESAFRTIDGVVDTQVGYIGGHKENPTYREVCSGRTGHAEALEITFDPEVVTYKQLVELFWRVHDPTQVNRQGPDRGTQYRSAIFVHSPEQKKTAEESKAALEASGKWKRPIATEIVPATTFWRAEEYHQRYFEKNGGPACHFFE